jgi:hypothetical protein
MTMTDLKYNPVHPFSREDLISMLASDDPQAVAKALYSATRFEQDWKWVQDQCLHFLRSPDLPARWAAATCLGDLAFFRRPLELKVVLPALEAAVNDPEIAGPAEFSLSMVRQFMKPAERR